MKAIKKFFASLVDGAKAVARIVKATPGAIKRKPGHMGLVFSFILATACSIAPDVADIESRANALKAFSEGSSEGRMAQHLNIETKKGVCAEQTMSSFFEKKDDGICERVEKKDSGIPAYNLAELPEAKPEDFPGMVFSGTGTAFSRSTPEAHNIAVNDQDVVIQKDGYRIVMGFTSPMIMQGGKVTTGQLDEGMVAVIAMYAEERMRTLRMLNLANAGKALAEMPTLA